jgi:hypothetical protein
MNYYIFYVSGESARDYLNGTNYVGVWEDTLSKATLKVKRFMGDNLFIVNVEKDQVDGSIGYLY